MSALSSKTKAEVAVSLSAARQSIVDAAEAFAAAPITNAHHDNAVGDLVDAVQHLYDVVAKFSADRRAVVLPMPPVGATLADLEKRAIVEAFNRCRGHRATICKELGVARATLHRKLRQYGLVVESAEVAA